jgi:hydrogenase maturation factor HypF (carbamoyltransferase family)
LAKCPTCKKEITNPTKTWKYWRFAVQAYSCENCGTVFNEYTKEGKHSFTLELKKGKGYVKA